MASSLKSSGNGAASGHAAQLAPQTGPHAGPALASTSPQIQRAIAADAAVCTAHAMLNAIAHLTERIAELEIGSDVFAMCDAIDACVDKGIAALAEEGPVQSLLMDIRLQRKGGAQ